MISLWVYVYRLYASQRRAPCAPARARLVICRNWLDRSLSQANLPSSLTFKRLPFIDTIIPSGWGQMIICQPLQLSVWHALLLDHGIGYILLLGSLHSGVRSGTETSDWGIIVAASTRRAVQKLKTLKE
jgi:hypothetical protein